MLTKNKDKTIWFFHHYATPPSLSGLTRPYNFGVHLLKEGYNVKVFAASFLHYTNTNLINNSQLTLLKEENDISFIFVKTPSYSNNGLKRLMNMIFYYKNLKKTTKKLVKNGEKPDIIIASSPHPLTLVAGTKIAKSIKVPCISEIRDFWPEVFFLAGRLKKNSFLGKLLIKGEHWIYKKSNALIFLKEGDYTYITDNKWDFSQGGKIDLSKCHYINNGVNIKTFDYQANNDILDDSDLKRDTFKVVYTGAIRLINDVNMIIDAAILLHEYKNIEFYIYGDGNQFETLHQKVINQNITNVKMKGYVEKKYIPYILKNASVNLMNYSQEKYNWSRGNSSNKLFEYMASGKPIISTVKMGYSPIEKYQCGISLDNDTPEDLAKAVLYFYNLPSISIHEIGQKARKASLKYDYAELSKKLIKVVNETIDKGVNKS